MATGLGAGLSGAILSLGAGAQSAGSNPQSKAAFSVPELAGSDNCERLTSLRLDTGKILSAISVKPPFETPVTMTLGRSATVRVPFCRVAGLLTPTPSSEINFEVWLPEQNYAGRFAGVGNGGLTGEIFYVSMAPMLNRGYAVFGSDRGHKGAAFDMKFASQPERVIDFRERADHLATVAAKSVVARYYGKLPRYSYWSGCSGGGVQAYTAAWLHPGDYDGIIAGAAPMLFQGEEADMSAMTGIAPILWKAPTFTKEKLDMVTTAAVGRCDADDGIIDKVISNPKRCKFDPATLVCRPGQTTDCLSTHEAEVLNEAYAAGHSKGAEYYWKALGGGSGPSPLTKFMGQVTYSPTPQQQFLQDFSARGGKMIAYVGMNDFPMPKMLAFQEQLIARTQHPGISRERAVAGVNNFHRLFLVPGMEHCAGGAGPNTLVTPAPMDGSPVASGQDIYSAIEAWVEKGRAPRFLVATKYKDNDITKTIEMTRPICAYPLQARWNGKGKSSDYRNFTCVKPSSNS
jgi:feruloyl esterase